MKERNTKQKEIILNYLLNTKSHPSIYELHNMIKEEYPSIGQATIYRNISKLVDAGLVRKITTKDGIIHYDGDITPHIHMDCTVCNKLVDIFNRDLKEVVEKIEKSAKISVSTYELLLKGTCHECLKKEK